MMGVFQVSDRGRGSTLLNRDHWTMPAQTWTAEPTSAPPVIARDWDST